LHLQSYINFELIDIDRINKKSKFLLFIFISRIEELIKKDKQVRIEKIKIVIKMAISMLTQFIPLFITNCTKMSSKPAQSMLIIEKLHWKILSYSLNLVPPFLFDQLKKALCGERFNNNEMV